MAVILNQDEDEQKNQANPLAPQDGNVGASSNALSAEAGAKPTGGADAAEIAPGAGAPAPAAPTARKSTSSGRFVNIENYLNANKNAQVGQALASNVKKTTDKTAADIEAERQKTLADVAANTPKVDASLNARAEAAFANPNNVNELNSLADQLQAATQAKYTGPTGLANEEELTKQALESQRLGKLADTESGRFELLRSQLGKPTYTTGQQKLDNLFLVRDQAGLKSLGDIKQQAEASAKSLSDARQSIADQAIAAKKAAEETSAFGKRASGDISDKLIATLKNRADQYNRDLAAQDAAAKQDKAFAVKQLDEAIKAGLGKDDTAARGSGAALLRNLLTNDPDALAKLSRNFAGVSGAQATAETVSPELANAYNKLAGVSGGRPVLNVGSAVSPAQKTFDLTRLQNLLSGVDIPKAQDFAKRFNTNVAYIRPDAMGRAQDRNWYNDQLTSGVTAGNESAVASRAYVDAYESAIKQLLSKLQ